MILKNFFLLKSREFVNLECFDGKYALRKEYSIQNITHFVPVLETRQKIFH